MLLQEASHTRPFGGLGLKNRQIRVYPRECGATGNHPGYKTVGDLFEIPRETIRRIVKRNPKDNLGVRLMAIRWGPLSLSHHGRKGD